MKINNIYLKNFRGFDELQLDLNCKSVVIFGANGVGKSSVLRALDMIYASIIGKITKGKKLADLSSDDIHIGTGSAYIEVGFKLGESHKSLSYFRKIDILGNRKHSSNMIKNILNAFTNEYLPERITDENGDLIRIGGEKTMPIFVNYGVNRLVVDTSFEIDKSRTFTQLSAFDNAIESKIDFKSFFSWFRSQEDLENENIVKNSALDIKYEDSRLKAVRKAILSMMPEFSTIRIDREKNTLMAQKGDTLLNINQLSDGEKCTMALFGDLARRLAIANPALEDPLQGDGVVLIDELDLHLHPQWQRKVIGVLLKTFPNIQFILTTHSPQILGEIPDDVRIVSIQRTEQGLKAVEFASLYGWDTNALLEDAMQTDHLTQEVKKRVEHMYEAYDNDRLEEAQEDAEWIDRITNGRNDSVAKMQMLISRKRRKAIND